MHVPDGFLGPQTYLPAYGVAAAAWTFGLRRLRARLDAATLPRLAVVTATAFVLMMITVPLPGGTTVHVAGIGMLAVLFGVWNAFLSLSLVFLLQALMFGDGGVTALPVNALAMGLVGSLAAVGAHRLLRPVNRDAALFAAGWAGTVASATLMAGVLGLQPLLSRAPDGSPLFFPFGWKTTLPAVVLPHLAVGVADGVLALLAGRCLAPRPATAAPPPGPEAP
ncbi:MAG: cobalamin biosynthesis protein CbiM [Gemmatimonas sp.]|nr:cobalamin biosynthesis protein CbiM [Gemmatimonas sp.]